MCYENPLETISASAFGAIHDPPGIFNSWLCGDFDLIAGLCGATG